MATQKELLAAMSEDIKILKTKVPNGEIARIESSLIQIESNQRDMSQNMQSLTKMIMDPVEGLIVSTNKNTDFRKMCEPEREATLDKFKSVLRWQSGINKVLWAIGFATITLVFKTIFY
jgi:hypothetical protein